MSNEAEGSAGLMGARAAGQGLRPDQRAWSSHEPAGSLYGTQPD